MCSVDLQWEQHHSLQGQQLLLSECPARPLDAQGMLCCEPPSETKWPFTRHPQGPQIREGRWRQSHFPPEGGMALGVSALRGTVSKGPGGTTPQSCHTRAHHALVPPSPGSIFGGLGLRVSHSNLLLPTVQGEKCKWFEDPGSPPCAPQAPLLFPQALYPQSKRCQHT